MFDIGTTLRSESAYGGGITFMRSVSQVKKGLTERLDSVKEYRATMHKGLVQGLKEEKRKPIDPETVLSAVRRVPYHAHARGMSERVQKLVKTATVVVRADEMIEVLGFIVEQLGMEIEGDRLLEMSLGDMLVIFRPFDSAAFEQACCGSMLGLGSPAVTSLSSFVGASSVGGQGYEIDSVSEALSSSDVDPS